MRVDPALTLDRLRIAASGQREKREQAYKRICRVRENAARAHAQVTAEHDILSFWQPAIEAALKDGQISVTNHKQPDRCYDAYYIEALQKLLGAPFRVYKDANLFLPAAYTVVCW